MINAYVMSRMKIASAGKHFSLRAIASTLLGEGADSVIFFPLAFGGILHASEIISLIIAQTLLKTTYETAILPITIYAVKRLKKIERTDTYDTGISYKWW